MTAVLFILLGAALALLLVVLWGRFTGFAAQRSRHYAGGRPVLDIRAHLTGRILCEGVIYGPAGRVSSRFVADMQATWQGDSGTLAEEFRYDSGAVQHRTWAFTLDGQGRIRATAPDVIGTGQGVQAGSALRMTYRIRLGEDAGGHVLDAVDWMYLLENGTILNRSQFFKYGIKVAELVATLRKVGE